MMKLANRTTGKFERQQGFQIWKIKIGPNNACELEEPLSRASQNQRESRTNKIPTPSFCNAETMGTSVGRGRSMALNTTKRRRTKSKDDCEQFQIQNHRTDIIEQYPNTQ
jgi:hypothetical protein